ncbi:MAG: hypothetical protein WA906_10900 [Pacificimonas sp.]
MSIHVTKSLTPCRIELASGTTNDGGVYLATGERLQDMLNGDGAFIPFRIGSRLLMLSKTNIASVELLPD